MQSSLGYTWNSSHLEVIEPHFVGATAKGLLNFQRASVMWSQMSLHLVHTQAGTSPAIRELSGSAALSLTTGMSCA